MRVERPEVKQALCLDKSALFAVDAIKFRCECVAMRNGNGTMKSVKLVAVYNALRKTNCCWSDAAKLLGMSARGVATLAIREGLVRAGRKLGEKKWVLA